jgi:response regulator RpfG family c-di-GMP phosphodiesterase
MRQPKSKKRPAPGHFMREHTQYAPSRMSSESCLRNRAKVAMDKHERYGVDTLWNA